MKVSLLKKAIMSLIPLFLAGVFLLVTVSFVRGQALASPAEASSATGPVIKAMLYPTGRSPRNTEPFAVDHPPQPFTPPGPWPSPDMSGGPAQNQSGGGYPPGWQKAMEQGISPPAWLEDARGSGSPLDWGGPDPFGYTYADSGDPWGPDPTFEDISGVGTAIIFTDFYYSVTLPFAFPFYENTHTQIYLYGDCLDCWHDWTNLAFGAPNPSIYGAVYWMDQIDRDSGSIYIYSDTLSSPARFIVQYDQVWNYSYGITTTSQVVLYENGDILVRYAEDFSWWSWWYGYGWQIPWLYRWNGTFYYAGGPQNNFAVQFYYPEGVWLWPPEQGGAGPVGGEAVYVLDLYNDTGAADSFTLAASMSLWSTTVSPTLTGVIPDGGVASVTVRVEVPPGATPGDTDAVTIQAASVTSPSVYSDTATISTTAVCSPALVFSGQSAQTYGDLDDTYDYGGQRFTYLYVSGFSEDNDTLEATVSGYDPDAGLWETIAQRYGGSGIILNQALIPPAYSRVRVQLDDVEDNDLIYYDYQLIVCRSPAVMLDPPWQQSFAQAGTTAVYTQMLTNYMMISDSFDLSVTGNDWPTTFWDGPTQITGTGTLADLETLTFTVKVDVPGGVTAIDDTATIRATSAADPGVAYTASLDTVVLAFPWAQAHMESWAPDGSPDSEQYLGIVRSSGVGTLQVTDDGEWQDGPPAVAAYPREAIVAAWAGPWLWNNITNYTNIEYAAFDVDGKTVVSVTQVSDNISATINTYDFTPVPAVAPTDGNVLIAWQRYEWADNYRNNIYYAVRGPDGSEVLTPTALTSNADQSEEDSYPSVATFDDGGFALTWRHWVSATSTADVYYAVLDSSGNLLAGPVNLTNNPESGWLYAPKANRLADNKVILTWTSRSWTIDYAVLDSTGDLVYPASRLSYEYGAGYADAVGLRNGNTIVAWLQWGGPEWMPQVAYAVLNSEYTTTVPISEAMRILTNTLTDDNYDLSLARDSVDNAVFTWAGDDVNIFYGVVDNVGEVRTWPMVFHPGQGYLRVHGGAGNGGLPEPALSITKTASPDPVVAGGLLTYTILVENNGYAEATGVTITDTLPENITFVSSDTGGTLAGDQVRWTGLTVAAGGSLVVQFVVQVSDTLTDGSILVNDDYGVKCAEVTTVVMGEAVSTTVTVEPTPIEEWLVYLPVVTKGGAGY